MKTFEWTGVFPALTTKFNSQEELDLPLFGKNLQAQVAGGVNGIILGGSLGEASTITVGEKESLVKFSLEQLEGAIPVVLNIAEGSTREAVRQAELAQTWGADGLMLLPPMRYKADDRETTAFFRSVAQSTDLPIMLYNNPVDYKIEITLDMFESLIEEKNITAVKESTRDVSNVTRLGQPLWQSAQNPVRCRYTGARRIGFGCRWLGSWTRLCLSCGNRYHISTGKSRKNR
nr:dihydrodipicolinate synthase family protein [Haliscomenobacter sp.]